jgi:hypothetical protein
MASISAVTLAPSSNCSTHSSSSSSNSSSFRQQGTMMASQAAVGSQHQHLSNCTFTQPQQIHMAMLGDIPHTLPHVHKTA